MCVKQVKHDMTAGTMQGEAGIVCLFIRAAETLKALNAARNSIMMKEETVKRCCKWFLAMKEEEGEGPRVITDNFFY